MALNNSSGMDKERLKNRLDLSLSTLEQTKNLMNDAMLDYLIEDYEDVANSLNLPNPNDNHVLATAIILGCNIILSFNIKDFLISMLDKYAIRTLHADAFFQALNTLKETFQKMLRDISRF